MFIAVSLLLVAVCVLPAAGKLLGHPKMRQSADRFCIQWPRYRLIGVAELAAAGGVLTVGNAKIDRVLLAGHGQASFERLATR